MTTSKYEKYVVRNPIRIQGFDQKAWSTVKDSKTTPPFSFLLGDKPIKGAHTMVEISWVWKDTAIGATPEKPPHKHDYDEIFMFIGANPVDTNDLGAEVEIWLGEAVEADKITLTTSSLVFIPRGLLHLPVIFRKVKKPVLFELIALNLGEMKPIKYPIRKISNIPTD